MQDLREYMGGDSALRALARALRCCFQDKEASQSTHLSMAQFSMGMFGL